MNCAWRNHSYLCIRYATHLDRPLDYCTEDGTAPRYCAEVSHARRNVVLTLCEDVQMIMYQVI